MMFVAKLFYFLCLGVVISNAAIVDILFKCGIDDEACQTNLVQTVLREITPKGASELGIPILDPRQVKQLGFTLPNLLTLKLYDGVIEGFKKCTIDNLRVNYEKGHSFLAISCPHIVYKGHYQVNASLPIVKSISGDGAIHGDGKTKVKFDQLKINLEFFFEFFKRDGKVYSRSIGKGGNLISYDIGKATFKIDNIYIGKEDASNIITDFMNNNWRPMFSTFGNDFIKEIIDVVSGYIEKFFSSFSWDHIIIEDLSHFVSDK